MKSSKDIKLAPGGCCLLFIDEQYGAINWLKAKGRRGLQPLASSLVLLLKRQVFAIPPLAPGRVIITHLVKTEKPKSEKSVRRTDTTLSISDDFVLRSDSDFVKHGAEFRGRFKFFRLAVYIV